MLSDRREYMQDYRQNYGGKMQAQIKQWFSDHPHYLGDYCKAWRKTHKVRYNDYMRVYMRWYRTTKNQEIGQIIIRDDT